VALVDRFGIGLEYCNSCWWRGKGYCWENGFYKFWS